MKIDCLLVRIQAFSIAISVCRTRISSFAFFQYKSNALVNNREKSAIMILPLMISSIIPSFFKFAIA